MKRRGDLFHQIVDADNILRAHISARKGKAHYKDVIAVNARQDEMLERLRIDLWMRKFTTSKYISKTIFDGRKTRLIHKLPYYPDRIVQHALISVCEKIWIKSYIRDTFQSIPGRGTSDARKRVWKAVKGNPGKYALKFDIQKYYPSVNHDILMKEVRRHIKCKSTLWLIDDIIRSGPGIPIGNYTSQHFGNLYLSRFDWWVKQSLGVKYYFRYCDDIVLIGDSAEQCHEWRKLCFDRLRSEYGLKIKSNWQVFDIDDRGLDFVGYVFRSGSVRLRPQMARRFKAKMRYIRRNVRRLEKPAVLGGAMAYWGWVKHANAKALWKGHVCHAIKNRVASFGLKKNPLERITP